MTTAFHPETDGASEHAIYSVNQVLRALIDVSQDNWHSKLPAVEFAMNSSISNSTSYAPFEINYGWMPTMINGLTQDTKFKGVKRFAMQAIWNMEEAHDALITSRVYQMHQANKLRCCGPKIVKGSKVYLSTTNLSLPAGRVRKFLPKYIGPYTVIDTKPDKSVYTLDLPPELVHRHIHPTFHVKLLRPYKPNDDILFPGREALAYYDFGDDLDQEWYVDAIIDHQWAPGLEFKVQWTYGDTSWLELDQVHELEALDQYLELHGVTEPNDLSH